MQVFKTFFKILRSHLPSIMIYFIIFATISILITTFTGNDNLNSTFTESKVDIAVIDHDNSEISQALYQYLDTTQNIVSIEDNRDKMSDELYYRTVRYILIIPENFGADFTATGSNNFLENIKEPNSTSGYYIDNQINQYLKKLYTYKSAGYDTAKAVELTNQTIDIKTSVTMLEGNSTTNDKSQITYFFQYLPYIFVCILIISLGAILITFRETDLSARIRCSALSVTRFNAQLILASFAFSLIVWLVFILLAIVLYHDTFFTMNGLLYCINSLVMLMFAMSFTFMVSHLVKTRNSLDMVGNVSGLGLSFLGGIFVPLELLSKGVVAFARFLPAYWYIKAGDVADQFNGSSADIHQYLYYIGVEFLFVIAALSIALAIAKLKRR